MPLLTTAWGFHQEALMSPTCSRFFISRQWQQASPNEYSILYHSTPSKGGKFFEVGPPSVMCTPIPPSPRIVPRIVGTQKIFMDWGTDYPLNKYKNEKSRNNLACQIKEQVYRSLPRKEAATSFTGMCLIQGHLTHIQGPPCLQQLLPRDSYKYCKEGALCSALCWILFKSIYWAILPAMGIQRWAKPASCPEEVPGTFGGDRQANRSFQ